MTIVGNTARSFQHETLLAAYEKHGNTQLVKRLYCKGIGSNIHCGVHRLK